MVASTSWTACTASCAETAICVETELGSLTTDVDFQRSLRDDVVQAGIFPYSLTSTSLGEVALRYQLRGPTLREPAGSTQAMLPPPALTSARSITGTRIG